VHNVQAVIDSLSMDVLHEDLSHLTGEAICGSTKRSLSARRQLAEGQQPPIPKPDIVSIEYLLEILKCIHEWIESRLESEQTSNSSELGSTKTAHSHENRKQVPLKREEPKFVQTVKSNELLTSQVVVAANNPEGKIELKNTNHEADEDVFKAYMKRKEEEYNNMKKKTLSGSGILAKQEQIPQLSKTVSILRPSSKAIQSERIESKSVTSTKMKTNPLPSSSSSSSSTLSSRSSSRSSAYLKNQKHVQFDSLPHHSRTGRRSVSNASESRMQTVGNELKQIKRSLDELFNRDVSNIGDVLNRVYDDDLRDAEHMMRSSLAKSHSKCDLLDRLLKEAKHSTRNGHTAKRSSSVMSNEQPLRSKGFIIPSSRRLANAEAQQNRSSRPVSRSSSSCSLRPTSSTSHLSSFQINKRHSESTSRMTIGDDGIFSILMQEFPHLYTSPETIHYLWQRHAKHIQALSKEQQEILNKYIKAGSVESANTTSAGAIQAHLRESYRKQQMLMNIMRKELTYIHRVEEMKRKREAENSLKARLREQRSQSARVKKHISEFKQEQSAKMLKNSTREELVFKRLFDEAMRIQRERVQELRKYAKEKSELSTKRQLEQIESIENYYKNKFDMLNERMRAESEECQMREQAKRQMLTSMRRQLKNKLENDIRQMQAQMCQEEDSLHWRQMDADTFKRELYKANYRT
jgi:centrosomal protein CEP95